MSELHPIVAAAARGEFPSWAVASPERRRHAARVAALMREWADELGLDEHGDRWQAVGLLHDALRDEDALVLRDAVPDEFADLPGPVLHGPAVAERMRREGVEDSAILLAVAFHTLGHPDLDLMGKALCCADFLEPGRVTMRAERDRMLSRMPGALDDVLYRIFRGRLERFRDRGEGLSPWTLAMWKRLRSDRGG